MSIELHFIQSCKAKLHGLFDSSKKVMKFFKENHEIKKFISGSIEWIRKQNHKYNSFHDWNVYENVILWFFIWFLITTLNKSICFFMIFFDNITNDILS